MAGEGNWAQYVHQESNKNQEQLELAHHFDITSLTQIQTNLFSYNIPSETVYLMKILNKFPSFLLPAPALDLGSTLPTGLQSLV